MTQEIMVINWTGEDGTLNNGHINGDEEKRIGLRNCQKVHTVAFMIDQMWKLKKQCDLIVTDRMIE